MDHCQRCRNAIPDTGLARLHRVGSFGKDELFGNIVDHDENVTALKANFSTTEAMFVGEQCAGSGSLDSLS